MWNNLKIGTRLVLAFGSMALLVALLMGMALAGIGGAAQALHDPAMAGHPRRRTWTAHGPGSSAAVAWFSCWPWCPFSDCARAS